MSKSDIATFTAKRLELRERIEALVDRSLADFVVVLDGASDEVEFRPERLETVIDEDATELSVALDWLEALDEDRVLPLEEALRRAVDTAVVGLHRPVVVRIHKRGDSAVDVPWIYVAGLTRIVETACRQATEARRGGQSDGQVDLTVDAGGSLVVDRVDITGDALLRAFSAVFATPA